MKSLAQACTTSSFFGIESWYKYIPTKTITTRTGSQYCELDFSAQGVGTAWLVIAGIMDILLRIAAIVAIIYFIFGAHPKGLSQQETL